LLDGNNPSQDATPEVTVGLGSTRTALALYGDPIVCRALVLLLNGPDYDVKHLPAASLGVAGTLTGVHILLLALERGTECRRRIFELLDSAADADGVHVLELTSALGGSSERRRQHDHAGRKISWPCSTEQLKRHIDTALAGSLLTDGAARYRSGQRDMSLDC
jgi:hypothetical protein